MNGNGGFCFVSVAEAWAVAASFDSVQCSKFVGCCVVDEIIRTNKSSSLLSPCLSTYRSSISLYRRLVRREGRLCVRIRDSISRAVVCGSKSVVFVYVFPFRFLPTQSSLLHCILRDKLWFVNSNSAVKKYTHAHTTHTRVYAFAVFIDIPRIIFFFSLRKM